VFIFNALYFGRYFTFVKFPLTLLKICSPLTPETSLCRAGVEWKMEQPAAGWTVRASKPFREKKLTDRLWVPPRFIFSAYIERGVKFTTHLCLVLRLKMTASITPLQLYAFMTWTVMTLTLTVLFSFFRSFSSYHLVATSQFIHFLVVRLISCLSHLFIRTHFMTYPYKIMDPRS
jgi:hypothetical protein